MVEVKVSVFTARLSFHGSHFFTIFPTSGTLFWLSSLTYFAFSFLFARLIVDKVIWVLSELVIVKNLYFRDWSWFCDWIWTQSRTSFVSLSLLALFKIEVDRFRIEWVRWKYWFLFHKRRFQRFDAFLFWNYFLSHFFKNFDLFFSSSDVCFIVFKCFFRVRHLIFCKKLFPSDGEDVFEFYMCFI